MPTPTPIGTPVGTLSLQFEDVRAAAHEVARSDEFEGVLLVVEEAFAIPSTLPDGNLKNWYGVSSDEHKVPGPHQTEPFTHS